MTCLRYLCLLLLSLECLRAADLKRPNILLIVADDWGYLSDSHWAAQGVSTPAFDRLAKEGVKFRNAHSAAPSCSASRAAMLTGQWHWRLEQAANLHGYIPAKFEVYPSLLEAAGYFIGLTGKGYGPGSNEGRPHNPAGPTFQDFDAFLAARPEGQPFAFWFGSQQPHRPYLPGIGKRSGMDPTKVFVPPYLPDNDTTRNDICDYLYQVTQFDNQCAAILNSLEKTGELAKTLIIITADNGWPFPRSKATCYDSGTHVPLVIHWGERIPSGRVVDDYVSLSDLAPTFLQAAGLGVPTAMTARSLLPILFSTKSGRVEPLRDHTLTGMERHSVHSRSDGLVNKLGYPMRSLISDDFHYIRNFKPERWPAGNPPAEPWPGFEKIATTTAVAFSDCDSGTTKAWLLTNRDRREGESLFKRAFGKRPTDELYDLKRDPFEMQNLAEVPEYADTLKMLEARLIGELKASGDPRTIGGGDEFDTYHSKTHRP